MGACTSKKTKTGKCESHSSRRESTLNSRAYKTTNPATFESNSLSHTQATTQRRQQTEKSHLDNGPTTKQACKNVKLSSEANERRIQPKKGRAANRSAQPWRTRRNYSNESYIDSKDMREFLELLNCPVCYQRIRGQIQKCVVGHLICVECRSKLERDRCPVCQGEMSKERMVTLENMVEVISMKCPYKKYGCRHTENSIRMPQHMEKCPYRVISCVDAKCSWEGKLERVAFHFDEKHSENVFSNTGALSAQSLKQDYTHTFLIRLFFHHNFFCRFKVCNATNTVSIAVQHSPTLRDKNTEWRYRLTLFAGIKQTLYSDLKVHLFKDTDSLDCADKSLVLPLHDVELFEVDGSIKYRIWLTTIKEDTPTSTVDGYCDVANTAGGGKTE